MAYATYRNQGPSLAAIHAALDARSKFIVQTYLHLLLAVLSFVTIEAVIFTMVPEATLIQVTGLMSGYGWLVVLGAFMLVSWIAERWARSTTSLVMQYAGLTLFVVAEAVIFVPLLLMARLYAADVIPKAGMVTLIMFFGLTAIAFVTRKDFSFLRGILMLAGFGALGVIVLGIIFGFSLGLFFSIAMVGLASGYILYQTSNIMRHYRTDQHVAASLALFAAVALLLWYVLRIFMSRD